MQDIIIKNDIRLTRLNITSPAFYWMVRNRDSVFEIDLFWNDIKIHSKTSDESIINLSEIEIDGIIYGRGEPFCFKVSSDGIIRVYEIYRIRGVKL